MTEDQMTENGSPINRRSLVAGLAMTLAAAGFGLGSASIAAKQAKKPAKIVPAKPATPAKPAKPVKVPICHFDAETGLYSYEVIADRALKAHVKHGDVFTTVDGAPVTQAYCDSLNPVEPDPIEEPED
jgi:hypothetical protein